MAMSTMVNSKREDLMVMESKNTQVANSMKGSLQKAKGMVMESSPGLMVLNTKDNLIKDK
jgi:hypothetical protein